KAANTAPLLLATRFQVPVGGTAGLALNLIDQGSAPTNLYLSFSNTTDGLTWQQRGTNLAAGAEFTHQAVLDGQISVKVARTFAAGSAQLVIRDTTPAKTNGPVQFTLRIEGVSPNRGISLSPAVWLDAATAPPQGQPVAEWLESSGSQRDGYQPAASAQPLSRNGAVRFEAGRFLYLDDRGLNAPQFTAFLSLDADGAGSASQTILRTANLQLDVQRNTTNGTSYLKVSQSNRATLAPLASLRSSAYLLTAGLAGTQLESADQGVALSTTNSISLKSAYPTIGALYLLGAKSASNTLQGNLRELVLFDQTLTVDTRAVLQDYQLSRWNGFVLWNYARSTLPISLVGRDDAQNILNGGLADDVICGGQLGDILRGGPGSNTLSGGYGPDRFVFRRTVSHDIVTDFNAADGDVIDLTEILDIPAGGTVPDVAVSQVVTRGTNNYPRVDTVIEVRHAGSGTPVNQTILLQNVGELPAFAVRLPAAGVMPTPPTFVSVQSAGSVLADAQGVAVVPDLLVGSVAVDRMGEQVPIFQVPAAGTLLSAGEYLITLTARDNEWNTAVTNSVLRVALNRNFQARVLPGGLELTIPLGAALESANDLSGPWTPVPGSGKVLVGTQHARSFFRLRYQ
ncbi:MAG: hypothetical protein RLY20_1691, partial [Verrucomicrobiota bacterium]